jgi:hypothetical protein
LSSASARDGSDGVYAIANVDKTTALKYSFFASMVAVGKARRLAGRGDGLARAAPVWFHVLFSTRPAPRRKQLKHGGLETSRHLAALGRKR